jgi:hypothetical protein
MQAPSHLIISWFVAEACGIKSPRDRRIVALSGLAPDIDSLAYVAAIVYFRFDKDLAFEHVWEVIHHRYTHGLGFVVLTGIVAFLAATRFSVFGLRRGNDVIARPTNRASRVALLCMLASAIHVFCDVVAGGPTWPVFPAWPLSDFAWAVDWSWTLGEWPNSVVLFACLAGTMLYARVAGYSPMESINYGFDRWFVRIIEHGSDSPPEVSHGSETRAVGKWKPVRIRILVYGLLILLAIAILVPLGFDLDKLNLPNF